MGAFANYDAYLAALRQNRVADFQMSAAAARSLRLSALWRAFLPTPGNPTTSVALGDTSDVAIGPLSTVNTGRLTLLGARVNPGGNSGVCLIVADILNQSGGLNGTLTTEQTTGLPTAALTRHTSGEGVMAGLILLGGVGGTATTFTTRYTNAAGVSGQISSAAPIGNTGFRESGAVLPIPGAAGDTGFRSVDGVTLAGTTGSAGNFGVVLFKPLAMMACNNFEGAHVLDAVSTGGFIGALAQSEPGACISILGVMSAAQAVSGSILYAEV
jgi:hypothetical protein